MPTLLEDVTSNTTGDLVSHTGPCSLFIYGELAGATITIEAAPDNDASHATGIGKSIIPQSKFTRRIGMLGVDGQGQYFLRAVLSGATAGTSVTVKTTQ